MGRPLAYDYSGFLFKGQSFPVWKDDTDPNQFYIMPATTTLAQDASGPQVNVVVCGEENPPIIEGLGQLVPYFDQELLDAVKKEYGPRIAVLPVTSAGQIQITNASALVRGLAVNKPWDATPESYEGMSAEQIAALEKARKAWEEDHVQKPLTSLLDSSGGFGIQVPTATGVNIGAAIPFGFVAVGKRYYNVIKGLLDAPGGGVIAGQVVYHFIGTTRPWAIQVTADLSKIHTWLSESFSVGYYWAKADIYREIEKLSEKHVIEVKVWDEGDSITTKYAPEKILDKILDKVLNLAFNYYPNMVPNKSQAQAEGRRWWWWNGSYSRKESIVEINSFFNIKIQIFGVSSPMPVTLGLFLRVPKYGKCADDTRLLAQRLRLRDMADQLAVEEMRTLMPTFARLDALSDFKRSL
jgi:hypothetical protein